MRGFGDIAERLRRSTVQIFNGAERGQGSGIVWSASGLILTNAHVARARQAEIGLWDGRRVQARVVSRDARRDLATLRIVGAGSEATLLEPATPGDSSALRPGELVIAVGNPQGFAGALSTGVVHSTGRLPGMGSQSWICADIRLAPGNSGGPLANAEGQVIGINTAIVNGLGVAVPAHTALEFLRRGAAPSLGVVVRPVPLGLELLEVEAEGAAANASLLAGDVLLTRHDELTAALDSGRPTLKLQFLRGDYRRVREAVVRLDRAVEAAA
jgi:serine protease Do